MNNKKSLKLKYKIIFSIILLFVVIIGSLLLGNVHISLTECFRIIGSRIPVIKRFIDITDIKDSYITIILSLRLPRTILALFVGAGLSAAGCVFQAIFANPMADPYLIGVSSGASLGATFAMLIPIPNALLALGSVSIMAFLGSVAVILLVFILSRTKGNLPTITIILSGISINYFITSFIALLMLFNKEKLENVYFWTLGSFKDANWLKISFVAVTVTLIICIIYKYFLELNIIMINEEQAKTLGVSTEKLKKKLLLISSLMVAVIVSVCGIIGFVGLITPHATRIIVGSDHKFLIPFSIIFGGIFTIISDTIARSILHNAEISVGIITALFGVPFFLILLYKNKKRFA